MMTNAKCKLQIEGVDFEIIANVGTMIDVEKKTGKSFMECIREAESGGVLPISVLLSSCLCKDGKPVGDDFISQMEFDVFEQLASPLMDTIIKAFPTKESKKKVMLLTAMEKTK